MGFHDYAASETSALLARADAARTDAPLRQLQSLREALDAVVHALETRPSIDSDVAEVVGRLSDAADAAVRQERDEAGAATDAARAELDAVRTELDAVRAELDTVRAELDTVRPELDTVRDERDARSTDLDRERGEREKLTAALADVEAATDRLRAEIQTERERADGAERDLAVTVDAHGEVENALRKAEAACKHEAQALQEARGLLELALGETAQVRGELEASHHQIAALKEELSSAIDGREQLEARHHSAVSADAQAKAAVDEELQEVRGLLELALAETTELRRQIEARAAEHGELTDALAAARAAREQLEGTGRDAAAAADAARAERDALAKDLRAADARVQLLEGERAEHDDQIRQLEGRLTAATGAEATLRTNLANADREQVAIRTELDARRGDVDRMASLLDVAVDAIGDLGKSTSVAELLASLVDRLATEFSRVALFRLKGNRLEGEHQAGFSDTTDVVKLVIPLSLDSLLTRVAGAGTLERLHGSDVADRAGTPFSGTPESAVALPLMLQGETFAVVYADRDTAPESDGDEAGLAFAKLLAAQTGVLLMRHTDELKTLRELRDYAALLLQEAEHMFSADREAGKAAADVRKRLRDNLDCASQLYAHRAALEGTAAATLLDDQIAAVIETGTPFAQDLAAIVGHMADIEAQITAEAS